MPIIVEDGTMVANANSYVSRATYIAFAAALGVTIANVDATDVQLIKSAIFIDQHENNLKGLRSLRDQSMSFPRWGVTIDNWYWSGTQIPRQVTLCQMHLALDINAGIDLWNPPKNPGLIATSETVFGAVSRSFSVSGGQKLGRTSTAEALLKSLLKNNGLATVELMRS